MKCSRLILLFFVFAFNLYGQTSLLDGLGLDSSVSKDEIHYSCTALPPSKVPAQFTGGEGVPPLPLPAVPLRRSEKKNPPRPPVLVIKVVTVPGDWDTNPADIDNLLKWMAENYNIHFSTQNKSLENIFFPQSSYKQINL